MAIRTVWIGYIPAPELLSKMSRLPPVISETFETHSLIDSADKTSNGSISMPMDLRCSILERLRAVAMTRRPRAWKA